MQIPAAELVPGDLIVLEEGDTISADARLIEEFELRTNNATLTGESEPVRKTASPHSDPNLTPIEMPNLVFAGTSVAYGGGKAVVYATGMDTQFGKIAELTQSVEAELSPLQKEMEQGRRSSSRSSRSASASLFFVLGYFVGGPDASSRASSSRSASSSRIVPEGLLPTVTPVARDGRAAHGRAPRAHQEALVGRDARLHHGDLHRQDRHAHQERDDRPRDLGRRASTSRSRASATRPTGDVHARRRGARRADAAQGAADPRARRGALQQRAAHRARRRPSDSWTILGDPTEAALLVAAKKAGFDYEAELERHRGASSSCRSTRCASA